MSLRKRRISRRALGVVVGASLLVLGLEAPAFAAAPVVSSFTPTSGPEAGGCVVVVTGTALDDFPATDPDTKVEFVLAGVATAAPNFAIISDTEIWVEAPAALTAGNAYNIRFTNDGGTSTSTGTFLAANNAGACAPTIASFTPTCGSAFDTVTITGTNLLDADLDGGEVFFSPYAAAQEADFVVPDVSEPTSLTVVVPSGSQDGPIRVTTFSTAGGTVNSATSFDVPPPDCLAGPVQHARSISLSLRKHLIAKGTVTVEDDTAECVAGVPVKIQRKKKGGGWKNVGSTTTSDTGKYKRSIKDKPGKYRAVAPAVTLEDTTVCSKDVSPRVRHSH